ncbi:MAG: response regulator transcription factor [Anaerolineae bacterium]|nr:response regulator transcription factor [Anaerolineae bacterium]
MNSQANVAKIQTVVAARPGAIRQALRSVLALCSQLEISGVANGGLSALSLVRQLKPALIVIDSGLLEDEIAVLLEQIKQEQPQIRCLVFADTTRQQAAFLTLGCDAVILRSEPTDRMVAALNNMGLW